jgi:hypothetical protein
MRAREKIKARVTPSPIAELFADLAAVPRLRGARCRGQSELFDRTIPTLAFRPVAAQARREALQVCRECPALRACRDWLDGLAPIDRPAGVIAGRTNTWREDTPR